MTGALLFALALIVAVASVTLASKHGRRALGLKRADLPALATTLERLPDTDRVAALLKNTEPGTWEHELAAEVLAAPDAEARVLSVNLALADVEHTLLGGAAWPPAALRIALLGTLFLAACAFLGDRGRPGWAMGIVGVGAVSALGCVEAGRAGTRRVERQRREIDALVGAAFALPRGRTVPPPPPRRPRRRSGLS